VIQHYVLSNILVYTINSLLFGTFLSFLVYFFGYKNQYQNIIKHDNIYNFIKFVLLISLGISYIFFIFFLYFFYTYYVYNNNYNLFNNYVLVPKLFVNFYFFWFEFSIDFFGIVLLFLAYFVGILSLLALDNRIF